MIAVLLENGLTDAERTLLIKDLYGQIHRHPQWTYRGNIFWIERMLQDFRTQRAKGAGRGPKATDAGVLDLRQAA